MTNQDNITPRFDVDQAMNRIRESTNATTDAYAAEVVAYDALRDNFVWCYELGWLKYADGVWESSNEAAVTEAVRCAVKQWLSIESGTGADSERLKKLTALLGRQRIGAIATLARGILEVNLDAFDQHPHLLNVGNGVVDLRTGELDSHNPDLMLTRITRVNYVRGATHLDWDKAIEALRPDTQEWMQIRIGQGATGEITSDDMLPVMQGGGENAKTTYIGAIEKALGDHAAKVPEKTLLGGKRDHSTELTVLRGARIAIIEETPEARHLNVKRLKDSLGSPTLTARLVGKDNMTWKCTHSMFLTTNYVPRVEEVDHGTWRRLALVKFPFTYRDVVVTDLDRLKDPTLRARLLDGLEGQHEAVLAYVVEGARRWYANGRVIPPMPESVAADTLEWRSKSDLILNYVNDALVFDPNAMVLTEELLQHVNEWLEQRGYSKWSIELLTSRFEGHYLAVDNHVTKKRPTNHDGLVRRFPNGYGKTIEPGKKISVWTGVRFRHEGDSVAQLASFEEQFDA